MLAERLTQAGVSCRVVDTIPQDAAYVVFLEGLQPHGERGEKSVFEVFAQLRTCARHMREQGRLLVTVQDSGGAFGLNGRGGTRAWRGGLAAFAKTAGREWPQLEVKAIDLECGERDAEALADALFEELVCGGVELEVGLDAEGRRITPLPVAAEVTPAQSPFAAYDVVVVSGGARGVTTDCLLALTQTQPLRDKSNEFRKPDA